jgi:hypothetical protein
VQTWEKNGYLVEVNDDGSYEWMPPHVLQEGSWCSTAVDGQLPPRGAVRFVCGDSSVYGWLEAGEARLSEKQPTLPIRRTEVVEHDPADLATAEERGASEWLSYAPEDVDLPSDQ